MLPMPHQDPIPPEKKPSLAWAIAGSLIVHGLVLFMPEWRPEVVSHPARRLEATLAPRQTPPIAATPPAVAPPPPPVARAKPQRNNKVLAIEKSNERAAPAPPPTWSVAERDDMNKFLRELDTESKAGPSLAQRSLAMAGAIGRQMERQAEAESTMVERLPGSPPVDSFSLEMYMDGLVSKLNRSAAFVKNDLRGRGRLIATVLVKVNPDGSLQSYKVLNAGDQQDEIAYTKSVVERALPFAAFPADIKKSVASLAMVICIFPAGSDGGGFGFTRTAPGRRC